MTTSRQRTQMRGKMSIHDEDIRKSQHSKQRKQISLIKFHTENAFMTPLQFSLHVEPERQTQHAKIIVGFPGIGKSFISKNKVGQYSWLNVQDEPGYAKGAEDLFFEGVRKLSRQPGVLLLPAHRIVGNFLISQNLVFTSVFPKRNLKDDYLRRYRQRGNSEGFVELLEKKWDPFIDNMWYDFGRCNHVELEEGEFLADVFLRILMQADACGSKGRL
jgi:hypothetical protein